MVSIEQYSQISPPVVYEEEEIELPRASHLNRKSNSVMRGSSLRAHAKIKNTTPLAAQKRSVQRIPGSSEFVVKREDNRNRNSQKTDLLKRPHQLVNKKFFQSQYGRNLFMQPKRSNEELPVI